MARIARSVLGICVLLMASQAASQQRTVDCDAGDDLQEALDQAVADELTWVAVDGTCEGNYELSSPRNITLEGRDAVLVSPDQNVTFRGAGPGWITLRGFEIRGGAVGVESVGEDSWVNVRESDVHGNGWGVSAAHGARLSVTFSQVFDNDLGMHCDQGSRCFASYARFRDNRAAVRMQGGSDLQSFESEYTGHADSGILVQERSSAIFDRSRFTENGSFHLALNHRSDVALQNGTVVGAAGDPTPLALAAGTFSTATTSRFGETVGLFGDVLVSDSAYVVLERTRVSGNVEIVDFGRVKILGTDIGGAVSCEAGGDAVCREGSSASTRGCGSAHPRCQDSPPDRR